VLAGMMTDPATLAMLLAPLTGPEVAPPEVFTAENVERILSLT